MIGRRNSVPISRKACVLGDDAAWWSVKCPGTIIGHRLMAMPRYDITNNPSAAKKGPNSESLLSDRQPYQTRPSVMTGTGARIAIFGQLNQRVAMRGSA